MSESALEDVKKIIKSLVIAHQNGLSPVALNNEYLEFEGRPIPWKSFGASSLFEFLKTLSDIIVPGSNRASEQVFFARVDSSTAHIANFVAHQRPTTIKRRNNIARNDLEKRPCRDPSPPLVPISVPIPQQPQHSPPAPPPERSRSRRSGASSSSNGNSDRRRDPERSERSERSERRRYREPSPMSISPPPRRTPTPEPERFRNPSPPRHGRSHSFRDSSPDRPSRRQSARDVFLNCSPQATPPQDYDKELAKAREKRGLPAQSSRSRRSRSRSPSPRRHRSRPTPPPPSPPRRRSPPIQTRSVSCQTDKEKVIAKKLVTISCQTDVEKAKTPTVSQPEVAAGDENEVNLNQAYYGSSYGPSYGGNYNGGPFSGFSLQPVPDPSYEEDASRPGFYYDFDAGTHKQIPLIPEWYAYWIWTGWVPPTSQQPQQPQQQPLQSAYPSHQPTLPSNPHIHSMTTTTTPTEAAQPALKFIPTTPTNNSATRDPRLARQLAANANNNTLNAKQAQVPTKRKALNVNDYLKSRKSVPDKSQFIINEEAQETPETLSNTLDYYVKLGAKRA